MFRALIKDGFVFQGESLEPSTQKNQVPRKHGMQILGKVPTSRRPPANLPSLKAETQTPGNSAQDQGNYHGNIFMTERAGSQFVKSLQVEIKLVAQIVDHRYNQETTLIRRQ